MFRGVAFDVDGTLIDTKEAIITSLQQVLLEETGRTYAEQELDFVLGIPGSAALEQLGVPDPQSALEKWDRCYSRLHDNLTSVFPGVLDVLTALRNAGVTLGLVTSKTRAQLDSDLARFGLNGRFHATVCADDTARPKPNPHPILKFLADTGLSPTEVLYVGDAIYDSRCAHAAGVKFALALWGATNPDVPCDYTVEHPSDLLSLCRR